jgi:hypothetical protein
MGTTFSSTSCKFRELRVCFCQRVPSSATDKTGLGKGYSSSSSSSSAAAAVGGGGRLKGMYRSDV